MCSPVCAAQFARTVQQRKFKQQARKERIAYRKRTESEKSIKAKAQAAFNRYIKIRDRGKPCISCESFKAKGAWNGQDYDAGHWHGVGAFPELRFKTYNCHLQCVTCNRYLSGHPHGYEMGLINRYGREWVERRKTQARETKTPNYSKDQLRRLQKLFNKKARLYENQFR